MLATPSLSRTTSSTEALKSAESLFESKNIAEIREVEAKTKGEIDDKKRQLRRLVGDSYRDLIEGADKIVAIAKTCDTILANVTNIQGSFSTLTSSITTTGWGTGERKESLKRHEELFAVGSRVKYLVDTPEMIWGCLDAQAYLDAARRYLRAQEVYRLLQSGFSADLLARFPLLSHQWPQVLKFKQQILTAVKAGLSSGPVQPVAQVADALAAAAALESLDSAATLQLLLSSRAALMRQLLADASVQEQPVEAVGQVLSSWGAVMQQTITQVAEVFLEKGSGQAGPHLLRVLRQADQQETSGLFFTPSPSPSPSPLGGSGDAGSGVADASGQVSAEASAWLARQREVEACLVPQAAGQVEQACSKWVAQLAADLHAPAKQLLSACTEAEHLCQVERTLRQAIAAWSKPAPAAGRTAPAGEVRAAWESAAEGESWEEVCEWVLGRPLNAWQELFHAPLLLCAKGIVAARFSAVRDGVGASIEACLQEASAGPMEPAGHVSCPTWPQFGGSPHPAAASAVPGAAVAPARAAADVASASRQAHADGPAGFRQRVQYIRQQLDTHLEATLATCLALLDTPTAPPTPHPSYAGPTAPLARPGPHSRATTSGRDASGRAAELEPFIQQQCADAASALASLLRDRFNALPTPDPHVPESARTVEQMLLVARLCLALSADSRGLQQLLGPPDAWRPQSAPASLLGPRHHSLGRPHGPKALLPSASHQALTAAFTATAHAAFRQWAQWAAAALAGHLRAGLLADEVLRLAAPPPSWAETVLSAAVEPEAGEEAGAEMRFSLPACPSVAVYSLLDCACQETRRAGGNLLGTEALQVLEWELLGQALQVLQGELQEGSPFAALVSERGVLQLLFDLRFLRDVLAGGRPLLDRPAAPAQAASKYLPEVQDPGITAALAERRRQWGALEGQLQERLDPIDWATYEPYLWANAEKYYHRCSVLLGTLGQLQRAYPEAAGKVQPSQELNPLNLLPVAPRFQYLPISAPTQLHAHASTPRASTSHLYAKLGTYTPAHPSLDESYSFANLGRITDSAAAAASAGADGTDAASGASTLSALQARLQAGSFGTLGSMLGDKAAEMTAMAQQRFETISLSDLSGGLLSSFAKGVARAPLQPGAK